MRKILYILIFLLTLSFVMSCGRSVDKRLVLADTLMWVNPDSSLAILSAVNRDSLISKEDLAYHALLLTQAQFRVEYAIPTDTLINNALDFYSDNHNREHYTRSLLYKGAFYEVHNNPVEAMKWFKQAEDNADTTDYRNLAQINMRMGMIYYNNYISNNLDVDKLLKAQNYYKKIGDQKNVLVTLLNLANSLRVYNVKDAFCIYDKAESLAIKIKDTTNLQVILTNKALLSYEDSAFHDAKNNLLRAYSLGPERFANNDYYILSMAYSKLGKIDSAIYFLNIPNSNQNTSYDQMMLYKCKSEIAIAKHDFHNYLEFYKIYYTLADSLEHNNKKYSINKLENDYEYNKNINNKRHISKLNSIITYGIIIFAILFILYAIYNYRKRVNNRNLINEIRNESFTQYVNLKNDLDTLDNNFSQIMQSQLTAIENIMATAYLPNNDYSSKNIIHKIKPIKDSDIVFWEGLRNYLNLKYNGIIVNLINQYPKLTDADINFIGLMCCGFSDAAIAVCRHYRNTDSVRSRRNAIKNKMGLDDYLDKYLQKQMRNE